MEDEKITVEQERTVEEEKQEERLFTKEEVNQMIEKRLARERRKQPPDIGEREKTLAQRELAVMAKEKLMGAGLPLELAGVLKYEDEESLQSSIEAYQKINESASPGGTGSKGNFPRNMAWGERQGRSQPSSDTQLRRAMGLNGKD